MSPYGVTINLLIRVRITLVGPSVTSADVARDFWCCCCYWPGPQKPSVGTTTCDLGDNGHHRPAAGTSGGRRSQLPPPSTASRDGAAAMGACPSGPGEDGAHDLPG